jgi:hypothetical protein
VHEDFAAVVALLRLVVVLALAVPVEVALRREDLAALAEELFLWFGRPRLEVSSLVLGKVAVPPERLSANIARQRCFP